MDTKKDGTTFLVALGLIVVAAAAVLAVCETKTPDETPKICRKARITATAPNGSFWEGKPEIHIMVNRKAGNPCRSANECTAELPVDGKSADVVITDVGVLKRELGRGTVAIPTVGKTLGQAVVDVSCIEY